MMFCPKCGVELADDVKFCNACGAPVAAEAAPTAPVEAAPAAQPTIIINNSNTNTNTNTAAAAVPTKKACNKWVSFFLCLFLGYFGAHKFYEGKIGMGFLYLFTVGLCGIGWLVDTIALLFKPNPYYV